MDFEKLIMEDMKKLEQQQVEANEERAIIVKQQEQQEQEEPESSEFTDEQLLSAGYLPKPKGLRMPAPMSHHQLRGDLAQHVVPVPRDYYKGNMHGDGKVKIYDSRGYDLFGDATTALVDIIKAALPEATDRLPAKYLDDTSRAGLPQLEGKEDESRYNELVPKELVNSNYGAIMRHPLARELELKPEDMALSKNNEVEIEKLLTGNELTMVKPWSIPCGVLGANENCVLLIDSPDQLTGQPGQLLAIFREGFFTDMPNEEVHYKAHTYTVQYDPGNDVKCQVIVQQELPFSPNECEMAEEMISI